MQIEDFRFSSSSVDEFFTDVPAISKTASSKVRVASVHQLSGFQIVAEDTLVRVSQKDFWKLGHDSDGYFIERLVDDDQAPITE